MRSKFERLDIEIGRVEGLNSGSSNRVMTHDGGPIQFGHGNRSPWRITPITVEPRCS